MFLGVLRPLLTRTEDSRPNIGEIDTESINQIYDTLPLKVF